jgi:hypothetical protein
MRTLRSVFDSRTPFFYLLLALFASGRFAALAQSVDECLECHAEMVAEAPTQGVGYGPPASHLDSVHGAMGFSCTDCHVDAADAEEYPHPDKMQAVDCTMCHGDVGDLFAGSVHGSGDEQGQSLATCAGCHGAHDIRSADDPLSSVNHFRVPDTCGSCHADPEAAADDDVPGVLACFDASVHGHALREHGLVVAPSCATCHGAHEIRRPDDSGSRVYRTSIPETCGECHQGILEHFSRGVHGQQLAAGNPAGPVCTDCHTYHQIRTAELSPWRLEVTRECGHCHEEAVETYRDTFHGKVTALGFTRVATCADCHDSHEIYPAENSLSTVSAENRLATCQSCHPSAGPKFAEYDPHADESDPERSPVLYWSSRFMKLLLIGVFTFFFAHTALWAPRSWLTRRRSHASDREAGS